MARQRRAARGRHTPDPTWFVRDRFGMFIHWGLYALPARHEWVKKHEGIGDADYGRYLRYFDPDLYDPADWAARAAAAGMRYAVITTKHHEGFCLFDSAQTDYKAPNTPAGRDLIGPWVEAFRARGLKVGFYYSLIDWHHPDFTADRHYPRFEKMTAAEVAAYNKGRDMKRYAAYMRAQVRELLTRYGKIDLMWFDFSYPGENGKGRADWESEKLVAVVRELQPHILLDNRLDLPGSGDFVTPEQYQPATAPTDDAGRAAVWEACQTFSGSWGYHRDEMTWKSVPQLLWMLVDGVSKGGNLLLNVGPTARGTFDHRACERLAAIGDWMRLHGRAIYGCGPAPADLAVPQDCRYTFDAGTGRLYLHLFNWPFRHLHLPGLAGRLAYAQFLHDASEVRFRDGARECGPADWHGAVPADQIRLELPVVKPPVELPVIELFVE